MRIDKAMVCAVSFVVASMCLAAAKPKTSTSADSAGNLDGAKVGYRSDDVVQLDVRIAGVGKKSAKSYVITTQFGQESMYKDVKAYNYQTERNEFKTHEVGVFIVVTPRLDDDGMISLNMMVHAVDEPTWEDKMKQPTSRIRQMDQRLRLSPGKPTVAQNDDLCVTVTPKIISLLNKDSSATKIMRNSNDVAQLDVQIAAGGKTRAKSCVITTPFRRESMYKDTREYQVERNVSEAREVGISVVATPELNDDGVISLWLQITVIAPTGKTTLGQRPFRELKTDQRLRLLPGKPMVVLDGDLRVTVTPRIIPSQNRTSPAAN